MNLLEQQNQVQNGLMFLTCDSPFGLTDQPERVAGAAYKVERSTEVRAAGESRFAAGTTRNNTESEVRAAGKSKFAAGTALSVLQSEARMAGESKSAADAARKFLQPVTVSGENGSELTIDDKNRISIFKDAAGRRFGFAYDEATGDLRAFAYEHGDWYRQCGEDRRYLNSWINSENGAVWHGSISIGKSGCTMTSSGEHVTFSPCGTKTIEKFASGELYSRTKEDAQGNTSHEDKVAQTISYKFIDGRSAIRDLLNHSLLGYDAAGRLTVMHDADGRKFEFQNYNADGQPQRLLNERGTWNNIGNQIWCNEETGRYWYGTVTVNDNGAYTYTDLSGKQTVRYCNGYAVEEYGGIRTITDLLGRKTRQFTDGVAFQEPPLVGRPKFVLKNGVTTDCELILERGQCDSINSGAEAYASIKFDCQSPIAAFQDGVVVYSTREAESNDQRKHALISLSEKDLALIERYKRQNLGKEAVVIQCYDRAQRAIRYQLYVGLEMANVVTGDKVKAGQPIGRIADSGEFTFAIRRNSVSGAAIPISSAR
jgi:hypothetical protein